jgi:DNA gyrase subunit A
MEKIAELINERTIDGIGKLRDETDRKGLRIVMELKRDATAEVVLNQLFKLTPLQTSFGIINLAILEGKPVICPVLVLLKHFIDHRRDVVTRRTLFELKKAKERMHILEGFRIALLNLDEVIKLIRASESPKEAKDGLMARWSLSDIQAQAILDLRLQKLTGMERLAVEQEHKDLAAEIDRLNGILADSKKVDGIIVGELRKVGEEFGDERRTEIVDDGVEIDLEDLIEDEEMVVTISHAGYVKRCATSVYRAQRRGGKGVTGATTKEEDFVEHLFVASTLADLLVFTSLGRLYWQKVYQIPEAGRTARGRALINLVQMKEDEQLTAILPVREFVEGRYIIMATKRGVVKKVELMEFSRSRKSGIIACTLDDGDALIGVALCGGQDDIILGTKSGMAIRFSETDVRPMGRTARGVMGVRIEEDDSVVGMTVVRRSANQETDESKVMLLTVCENGYGKRTRVADYRAQHRGGKGLIDIQTGDRNGLVVSVAAVTDDSHLMLITTAGKIIRIKAKDISVIGRNTMGVRLINLDEGEKVGAVAPLVESEAEMDTAEPGVE